MHGTDPIDYDRLAEGYDTFRDGRGPYIPLLAELAGGARRVLELATGTGNAARHFTARHGGALVALEPSAGMLAHARAKGVRAEWVRGRAQDLPFADGSFEFVFACWLLHHVGPDLPRVLAECRRVLRGGRAAFVTSTHAFIERHPMNDYFPSLARVDTARFPAVTDVERALAAAGFRDVASRGVAGPVEVLDARYVAKVKARHISTYELIPDAEYRAGLARLEADVAAKGSLRDDWRWEAAVVWGSVRDA